MNGTSLLTGWFSWLVMAAGFAAAAVLVCQRARRWLYLIPTILAGSGLVAWVLGYFGGKRLFAAPLNPSDMVWIGVALAAVAVAVAAMYRNSWRRRLLMVVAAAVMVAAAGNQVNKSYVEFPTIGDVFGAPTTDAIAALPPLSGRSVVPAAGPLTATWTPTGPAAQPGRRGRTAPITIPATASGFAARPGWVYLPPAYFALNPEPLPVMILLSGQPGSPDDWLVGDRVQNLMNDFADSHHGISPVVVIPDSLGSVFANPLCADSSLGRADTYLATDLPNAIRAQLQVDPDPRHWVVAGFSYGGTCALQLATNHPDVFPHFIDIAGQPAPTLDIGAAGRQLTIDKAFGGDQTRFTAINPADVLTTHRYPSSSGWFIWGQGDPDTGSGLTQLETLARAAGMSTQEWIAPGSAHDWDTAVHGLAHVMNWAAQQMDLVS